MGRSPLAVKSTDGIGGVPLAQVNTTPLQLANVDIAQGAVRSQQALAEGFGSAVEAVVDFRREQDKSELLRLQTDITAIENANRMAYAAANTDEERIIAANKSLASPLAVDENAYNLSPQAWQAADYFIAQRNNVRLSGWTNRRNEAQNRVNVHRLTRLTNEFTQHAVNNPLEVGNVLAGVRANINAVYGEGSEESQARYLVLENHILTQVGVSLATTDAEMAQAFIDDYIHKLTPETAYALRNAIADRKVEEVVSYVIDTVMNDPSVSYEDARRQLTQAYNTNWTDKQKTAFFRAVGQALNSVNMVEARQRQNLLAEANLMGQLNKPNPYPNDSSLTLAWIDGINSRAAQNRAIRSDLRAEKNANYATEKREKQLRRDEAKLMGYLGKANPNPEDDSLTLSWLEGQRLRRADNIAGKGKSGHSETVLINAKLMGYRGKANPNPEDDIITWNWIQGINIKAAQNRAINSDLRAEENANYATEKREKQDIKDRLIAAGAGNLPFPSDIADNGVNRHIYNKANYEARQIELLEEKRLSEEQKLIDEELYENLVRIYDKTGEVSAGIDLLPLNLQNKFFDRSNYRGDRIHLDYITSLSDTQLAEMSDADFNALNKNIKADDWTDIVERRREGFLDIIEADTKFKSTISGTFKRVLLEATGWRQGDQMYKDIARNVNLRQRFSRTLAEYTHDIGEPVTDEVALKVISGYLAREVKVMRFWFDEVSHTYESPTEPGDIAYFNAERDYQYWANSLEISVTDFKEGIESMKDRNIPLTRDNIYKEFIPPDMYEVIRKFFVKSNKHDYTDPDDVPHELILEYWRNVPFELRSSYIVGD